MNATTKRECIISTFDLSPQFAPGDTGGQIGVLFHMLTPILFRQHKVNTPSKSSVTIVIWVQPAVARIEDTKLLAVQVSKVRVPVLHTVWLRNTRRKDDV